MGQISERKPLHILSGNVIHGRGIGKLVGMPTVNMEVSDESILPPVGGVLLFPQAGRMV